MFMDYLYHHGIDRTLDERLILDAGIGFGIGESSGDGLWDFTEWPQKHHFTETYIFCPKDPNEPDLGAEVEFWVGEGDDAEKIYHHPENGPDDPGEHLSSAHGCQEAEKALLHDNRVGDTDLVRASISTRCQRDLKCDELVKSFNQPQRHKGHKEKRINIRCLLSRFRVSIFLQNYQDVIDQLFYDGQGRYKPSQKNDRIRAGARGTAGECFHNRSDACLSRLTVRYGNQQEGMR